MVVTACGRVAFDPLADGATDGTPVDAISPVSFASLCLDQRVTVILCNAALDDNIAMVVPATLAAACATSPTTTTVQQTDPGVLAPVTRQPLIPSTELGVMVGGDGPQEGLSYLVQNDTPVIWTVGTRATIQVRATGATIINMVNYGPAHDYGVIMMVRDAVTGTRYLSLQGPGGAGTAASGYWFNTVMAPTLSSDTHTWYVIDWMDTDTSNSPSSGDTFTILASD